MSPPCRTNPNPAEASRASPGDGWTAEVTNQKVLTLRGAGGMSTCCGWRLLLETAQELVPVKQGAACSWTAERILDGEDQGFSTWNLCSDPR